MKRAHLLFSCLVLAACGPATQPVLTVTSQATATVISTTVSTSTHTALPPTLTPTVVPAPRVPWLFRGASAGVPTWDLTESGPSRSDLTAAIRRMKADGVTWYELGTTWFMDNLHSTEIQPIYQQELLDPSIGGWVLPTLTDQRLEEIIGIFHENGISVFLRPNLLANARDNWRGAARPTSWDAWFLSYTGFITHYALLAERNHVDLFSIGLELNSSVDHTDNWNAVIAAVRAVYSGSISYDCGGVLYNGDEATYSTKAFSSQWEAVSIGDFAFGLDYIGIDWYPQLTRNPDAPVDELAVNAQAIADEFLKPVFEKYQKPIYFAEIDYSSMDRTTLNPLRYRTGGVVDEGEQASAFEAIFRTFQDEPWFAGMFPAGFYLTVFKDQEGTTNSLWYKEAASVFKYWYTGVNQ